MMNECIPVEQLGSLGGLPHDDPRRTHAATCPRCSALLFSHEEFVRAEGVDGADIDAAHARLSDFIAMHVEQSPPDLTPVSGVPRPERGRGFDFSRLRLLAAAAVVVVAVVALLRWQPWAPDEVVYRGETSAAFTGLHETRSAGIFRLEWAAVDGADSYRVTILAGDLSEITRLAPISELSIEFDPRDTASSQGPVYWQVTALVEGGELRTSDPRLLP